MSKEEEALCHIKTSSHCESLSAVPYLEKFNNQYIRKLKAGYFCEFCNKLMQTTMHVNLHLCEEYHQQNRGRKLLKSLSRGVIAFNNVHIEERAWHGIIDNVCCICVTEFEDEVLHKQNASHALSLIQRPVKFGENDAIYRPIDNSSFHCITCNKLLSSSTMNKHFNDADHLDLYSKCKVRSNKDSDEKDSDAKLIDTNSIYCDDINKNEINSYTREGNDDNVNKDETQTAFFKKSSIDIYPNQRNIEKDIADHLKAGTSAESDESEYDKTTEINVVLNVKGHHEGYKDAVLQEISHVNTACKDVNALESGSSNPDTNNDNPSSTDVIRSIAKNNNITYSYSNNAFCHPCQVKIPFTLKSINEHVKEVRHKKKLTATQTRQAMVVFVHSLLHVQSRSVTEINSGYLINNKYYLTLLSYLLLAKNTSGDGLICLLCGITLPRYPEVPVAHIDNCSLPKGKHIQIITCEKEEFIREIQPDAFHCGFCHIVVSGWNKMQGHLQSPEHDRQKSDSYYQFQSINLKLLQR
ncbi:unnamed protein product [Arctia plantaginis]|uniref:C2H2-type domain-containing protein n=1 Tax=Arctia plantaginis TaxID=874455 RepID=A0A8S0ZAH7_ARCPL|nr:unnamed protein product [Arctia plantaginis]